MPALRGSIPGRFLIWRAWRPVTVGVTLLNVSRRLMHPLSGPVDLSSAEMDAPMVKIAG